MDDRRIKDIATVFITLATLGCGAVSWIFGFGISDGDLEFGWVLG